MNFSEIIKTVLKKQGNAFFYTPSFYDDSKSYLFTDSIRQIDFNNDENLSTKFSEIDSSISDGIPSYGLINYEFAYMLEERFKHFLNSTGEALFKFYLFDRNNVTVFNSNKINFDDNPNNDYLIREFKLSAAKNKYLKDIEKIKNYIAAGDTYQVNYTSSGMFDFRGSIEGLILNLIFNQSGEYVAIINEFPKLIISISPELFFTVKGNIITAKPMKGTTPRGINRKTDSINKLKLLDSGKDKAENIMIVDLLRNDLGRICELDSVCVKNKFQLEKYETVYQLTSTIEGRLLAATFSEIIKNIFPCGSITGAPKIRTMEIIHELENRKRGIYTGAIGFYADNKTVFNVPIRTIELDLESGKGLIGMGGGIVWDSNPVEEYNEMLLKAEFLLNLQPQFEIIETMLVQNKSIFLLEYHLKRLEETARFFLFKYDSREINSKIDEIVNNSDFSEKYKLRLKLNKWGRISLEINPLKSYCGELRVQISDKRVNSGNKFLYFKTTNRELYDLQLKSSRKAGFYEALFLNEKNELTEGCISSLIIKKNNKYYTPPISSGILDGCYRQYFLDNNNNVFEKSIFMDDLIEADEIFLCNSVRKMVKILFDSSE
ncbi:MAG: bifunctional anthranilate synthase component I family protein/aminotransferase class IV [Bacteroidetes bacterium]|nr:bifunctional anthranilate synthase component I family protein/aminotransferase class IV [Bacteroidota bacterium]